MSDGGALLVSEVVEAAHSDALERAAPGLERVVARHGERIRDPARLRVVYFSHDLYPDHVREVAIAALKAEGLDWLHSFSAGVDNPFFGTLRERGVRLTTSSGAQAVPIAHTVLAYLLALSRDLRGWDADQRAHRWAPRDVVDLQGQVVCVVGLGPIGLEVARLAQAFRMRVIGVRRRPRGDEPCEAWPLERLPELLPTLDHLVLAVPLHADTHHLIDAAALARMKPSATLVNIARGAVVDEAALVAALARGRLGGAGLDVFEQEPLPETSPLWDLPNVIVTPHSSGSNPGNARRATEIFLDNLARYVRGEPLQNEVR